MFHGLEIHWIQSDALTPSSLTFYHSIFLFFVVLSRYLIVALFIKAKKSRKVIVDLSREKEKLFKAYCRIRCTWRMKKIRTKMEKKENFNISSLSFFCFSWLSREKYSRRVKIHEKNSCRCESTFNIKDDNIVGGFRSRVDSPRISHLPYYLIPAENRQQ